VRPSRAGGTPAMQPMSCNAKSSTKTAGKNGRNVVAFIVAVLEEARSHSRICSAQYIMLMLPVVSGESTGSAGNTPEDAILEGNLDPVWFLSTAACGRGVPRESCVVGVYQEPRSANWLSGRTPRREGIALRHTQP
jgi:hypothetical protein